MEENQSDRSDDSLNLPKRILEMGPSYFKVILMKPTQRTISYIAAVYFSTLRITMMVLSLMLLPEADSLTLVVDVISAAAAFSQGLKSTVPIVFYKDSLLWLTTQTSKFWPTTEETRFVDDFYRQVIRVLLLYKQLFIATYISFVPMAIIFQKLPFITWIPPIRGGFYILFCLQFMMLTFDATLVCGSDTFFVGACGNIHAQFVLLHHRLTRLGANKSQRPKDLDREVIECVQHHDFLLSYTNVLIKMYSIGLVFQFFVTTYALCIEIFIFTRRDTVGMIIGAIYCSMLTCQLALYCFPADAVIDITEETAEAVYSCPWYDHSKELKNIVLNCIARSRKPPVFTAGGFLDIDKRSFTKIFKGILSLNTLMQNMEQV